MTVALLLLTPVDGTPPDGMTHEEALEEILEGLREGAYEPHSASDDGTATTLVATRESARTPTLLGGRADALPSIRLSRNLLSRNRLGRTEAVSDAITILSTPRRGGSALGSRIARVAAALVRTEGPALTGVERPDADTTLVRGPTVDTPACALVMGTHGGPMEFVLPSAAALLPVVIVASWRNDEGDTTLSMSPFMSRIRDDELPDAMEALRVLAAADRDPLV